MLPPIWKNRDAPLFSCILLTLLIWVVYAQTLDHNFIILDDGLYVTENPRIHQGLNWDNFFWAFQTGQGANWHPLTWLSHMADCTLFGLEPGGHHLTNLLLHTANSMLLFLVLHLMTGALRCSLLVAALFALHPLHVESVAWVAERKDVLSTFFGLLCIGCYHRYTLSPSLWRYLPVAVFLALGLMAKPMLVTWPFVLLLLDYWPLRRFAFSGGGVPAWRLVLEKVPLFVMIAASCVVTFAAQQAGGAVKTLTQPSLARRLANATDAYLSYLVKTVWPDGLALIYPFEPLPAWKLAMAVTVLSAISVFVVVLAKRYGYLLVGWCWYLGTLVPVIGLVQVGTQRMADRYTYIPLIGLFIIVVWGTRDFGRRLFRHMKPQWSIWEPVTVYGLLTIAVIGLAAATDRHIGHWRNSTTILSHTLRVTGPNAVAHYCLGSALQLEGRLDQAEMHYKKALAINPKMHEAHTNLGSIYAGREEWGRARKRFSAALDLKPNSVNVLNNFALVLLATDNVEQAVNHLQMALEIDPKNGKTLYNLAVASLREGDTQRAKSFLERVLRNSPQNIRANLLLGSIFAQRELYQTALVHFGRILSQNPHHADTLNQAGLALMRLNHLDTACVFFERAVAADPEHAEAIRNLKTTLELIS